MPQLKSTLRDRLIIDCRNWWRFWSLRFNALGLAILAWVQIDPVSTLGVWNMMPYEVKAILPQSFIKIVGLILVGLGMMSRLVKQPKLNG